MSDNPTPEATPESGTPAPEATPAADGVKTFSLEYVQELRRENAAHRTSKTEAVETAVNQLKADYEAKLAEKDTAYTELQNELGKAWVELEKINVSIDAKVPSDKVRAFVEILKGDDKESITESAKSGLELFGGFDPKSPAFDPSQGRGGKPPLPLNGDPILEAIKAAVGIKK